jgi:hypothetical protein
MEVPIMFSRRSTRQALLVLLTAALLLTACNVGGATPAPTLDINAMNTAIVGTTVAQLSVQFTQTALAAPTNTALPTETSASVTTVASPTLDAAALPTFSFVNTPAAGSTPVVLPTSQPASQATAALGDACSNSAFEGDITIPDGETLKPGFDFQKIWAIRNTGNCTWDEGFTLVYIAGSKPDLDPYNFEFKNSKDFVAPGQGLNIGINLTTPCTPGKYEGHWRMRNDRGYYFGTILSVYVTVVDKC